MAMNFKILIILSAFILIIALASDSTDATPLNREFLKLEIQHHNIQKSLLGNFLGSLRNMSEKTWHNTKIAPKQLYKVFKSFTEMSIFDPLQIQIRTKTQKMKNGNLLHVPFDKNLNHYFIGK